jgi:hypothetical protein
MTVRHAHFLSRNSSCPDCYPTYSQMKIDGASAHDLPAALQTSIACLSPCSVSTLIYMDSFLNVFIPRVSGERGTGIARDYHRLSPGKRNTGQ